MKIRQKFTIGLIVIAMLVGAVGYFSLIQMEKVAGPLHEDIPASIKAADDSSYLDALANLIRYYDEVLTQSARNYAFTGDKRWEDRYREVEPRLDATIKEAIEKGDRTEADFFSGIDQANIALVEMEYRAIGLAEKGQRAEAVKLLESTRYWDLKKIYEQSLKGYLASRGAAHHEAHIISTEKLTLAAMRSQEAVRHSKQLVFIVTTFALILAIGFGAYMSRQITRPVENLNKAIKCITRGDIAARAEACALDEIGYLTETFNTMTEVLAKTTVSRDRLIREVEERKIAEEALKKSEKRLKAAQHIGRMGDWDWDVATDGLHWSDEIYNILGVSRQSFVPTYEAFLAIVHPDDRKMVSEAVSRSLAERTPYDLDHRIVLADGEERIVHEQGKVACDESGAAVRMAGTIHDVTERKLLEKKLETLSLTDELTGLYNRRGFLTLGEKFLRLAAREKSSLYMLYADLDGLKAINDTLGHKEGDGALVEFAKMLVATYRESDIVARIGGDEFTVIPVGTTEDCIERVTARLKDNLARHNAESGRGYSLSASVGIACYEPESGRTMEDLLAEGDRLMYEQKQLRKKS